MTHGLFCFFCGTVFGAVLGATAVCLVAVGRDEGGR